MVSLPLNLIVTDVGELQTDSIVVEAYCRKTCTSSIVRDVVVTAHIITCIHAQIVDTCILWEPRLVSHNPTQLYAWEQSPCYTTKVEVARLSTETAISFSRERNCCEVTVHVVIVYITIPLKVLPYIVVTLDVLITRACAKSRVLIVGCRVILCLQVVIIKREVGILKSTEGSKVVLAILVLPIDMSIADDVNLLREQRSCHTCYSTEVRNLERRYTNEWTMIALRVTVQCIAEHRSKAQVIINSPCRFYANIEISVLSLVLVVAICIIKDGDRVSQTITRTKLAIDIIIVAKQ